MDNREKNPFTGSNWGVNLGAEDEAPTLVAEVRILHAPPNFM